MNRSLLAKNLRLAGRVITLLQVNYGREVSLGLELNTDRFITTGRNAFGIFFPIIEIVDIFQTEPGGPMPKMIARAKVGQHRAIGQLEVADDRTGGLVVQQQERVANSCIIRLA